MMDAFILFTLVGTTYAVRTRDVLHIEMVEEITPVPNATGSVDGVVFSRGQVVPVVNLRARFGFERVAPDLRSRLLVVQSDGRTVGLMVDSAREFARIARETIKPPQDALTRLSGRYLEGIALVHDRIVLVLDLSAVIEIAEPLELGVKEAV
jgi:purine-binding chemotaxis protein CheW